LGSGHQEKNVDEYKKWPQVMGEYDRIEEQYYAVHATYFQPMRTHTFSLLGGASTSYKYNFL
jgi:hypothetical protein